MFYKSSSVSFGPLLGERDLRSHLSNFESAEEESPKGLTSSVASHLVRSFVYRCGYKITPKICSISWRGAPLPPAPGGNCTPLTPRPAATEDITDVQVVQDSAEPDLTLESQDVGCAV